MSVQMGDDCARSRSSSWRDLPIILVQQTTSWEDLPPDLVTDILTRLPVKTLIRSTSVNKSWYALIKNPKFISLHIYHSISLANKTGNHYLLVTPKSLSITTPNPCSLISDKTGDEISKFEIPFTTQSGSINIIGSVNGLLCLTDPSPVFFGRDLYLWNPSVKKHLKLGPSCLSHKFSDWKTTFPLIGFGFHEASNDYRVVRIMYFADADYNFFGKVLPRIEVFSVRRNSWRIVETGVPRIGNHESPIFTSGSIHWLAYPKGPKPHGRCESILSFDLDKEVAREVKFPDNYREGVGRDTKVSLVEFKGSLGLCVFDVMRWSQSQCCCIWVMTENGGTLSWVKETKVVLKERLGWPMKFTKGGKLIQEAIDPTVQVLEFTKLVLHDLENQQFKDIRDDGPCTVDAAFVESLVLLEAGNPMLKHSK